MSKRRPQGEGTIYYDEKADRYVGQIDLGHDGTGRRRRAKVTGKSEAEVARKLRERRKAIEAGDQAPATMTVADLLDAWTKAVLPTLTPNTASNYRWAIDHLRRDLGKHRLTALRAHHVEASLRARADGGLNATSVSRLRTVLGRVLRWGQRRDLVARNVAELAELPPARPAKEGRALTRTELGTLLAAAEGTRMAAVWTVLAGLGLRPGEALGLTWDDVDLDGSICHVRHALRWRNGSPELGDLKTKRSRRSIAMPAPVVEALRAHRARWSEEHLARRGPEEWSKLVFSTEAGTPVDASNLRRELDRLAKVAELGRLRPYDLRHTAASLMADAGVRLEAVADVLGHDGIRMARMVYTHAVSPTVDAAVTPLGDALGRDAAGSGSGA